MKDVNQNDNAIYFIGWNKRIELTKKGQVLLYSERNDNGSSIRLRCDMSNKRMVMEKKEENEGEFVEMSELNIIRGAIMDLGDNGERWEGDLLNGLPFGYGCVYNSESELVYAGFAYEGEKICFGEEFEKSKIEYCGTFYKNRRHGNGKLYNLKGELVYEGSWYFGDNTLGDVEITTKLGDSVVHNEIKKLIIGDGYHCGLKELKLTDFPVLESIRMGNNCFEGVKFFEISNCVKLEVVVIGKSCFSNKILGKAKGCFLVRDCSNLRDISIDDCSFYTCSYITFESE